MCVLQDGVGIACLRIGISRVESVECSVIRHEALRCIGGLLPADTRFASETVACHVKHNAGIQCTSHWLADTSGVARFGRSSFIHQSFFAIFQFFQNEVNYIFFQGRAGGIVAQQVPVRIEYICHQRDGAVAEKHFPVEISTEEMSFRLVLFHIGSVCFFRVVRSFGHVVDIL